MNNLSRSRTMAVRLFAAALRVASAGSALAAVRYVDVDSANNAPPYTSWATAATNIQDAVDAAVAGDEIVVTNGSYGRVSVGKPLTLRSVNGPEVTSIHGVLPYQHRCVYLTNGASLSGFTLAGGYIRADGAGVFCESKTAVLSNCVLSGNTTFGGARGAGAYGGTLNNCTLRGNSALDTGLNCRTACSSGGGAFGSTLNNCTLIGNYGGHGGGVASCILNNCTLADDSAYYGGGASDSALNNCALTGNSAIIGGGAFNCTLNNCTLTGNSAPFFGVGGGGVSGCILNNCIVYFNTAPQDANYDSSSTLNYSCTTPLPTNGVSNLTNEPAFVNFAAGNYRLRPDSPCIDAGTNLSTSITNDLDGRPRPLDGNGDGLAAFDMGAYEYRTPLLVWQGSPNPTPPHADWATAAHTIQDAVDAAVAGDEIVVTNGIYSVGGRAGNRVAVDKRLALRSVNGSQCTTIDGGYYDRCVSLAGATMSGFTLTHGVARASGGGGGAHGGTLNNCTLMGNSAYGDIGVYANGGGAAYCTLNNCTLIGNWAHGLDATTDCCFNYGGGAWRSTLNNCTLAANIARFGGGASASTLNNCIVYFNRGPDSDSSSTLNYCCTTYQPSNGFGNITNAPLFVDLASGNLRLQSNSPCINGGQNALAPAGPDLDGNPRIAGVVGTVDIGAYEFQSPASMISYAWLQQFNLPINLSTDTADPDDDHMNNWQEWRCATDPTNALSALRLLAPVSGVPGVIVSWQSVSGRNYFLERGNDLGMQPPFLLLRSNLTGQAGTTSCTDTNAVGPGPFFYRVGVED